MPYKPTGKPPGRPRVIKPEEPVEPEAPQPEPIRGPWDLRPMPIPVK